jgi:alpha-D-ribose 1-methylphosphonate 5-triphosphate synthase subunit PhnH
MRLDVVHDVQRAYRKLVEATSFPGRVVDVSPESEKVDLDTDLPRPLLLLSLMLLDAEVRFFLASSRPESHAQLISQLTYSRVAPPHEAEFVFVCGKESQEGVEVISEARVGTLTDPHRGATVGLEVEALETYAAAVSAAETAGEPIADARSHATPSATSTSVVLSGPGIDGRVGLSVRGPAEWTGVRAKLNGEYPLGVDFILFTADGRVVSLPRTTQLEVA